MIIDYSTIYNNFKTLVGFVNENEISLTDVTLNQSDSGLFVNNVPGISLDRIQKVMFVNADNSQTDINDYLNRVRESVTKKVCDNFVSNLVLRNNNNSMKVDRALINRRFCDKGSQNERFVGYYISFATANNIQMSIDALSFTCTEPQTIRIFMYNLNTLETVFTYDLVVAKGYARIYTDITEQILKAVTDDSHANEYLIGYYENQTDDSQSWQLNANNFEVKTDVMDPNELFSPDVFAFLPVVIDKENLTGYDCPILQTYEHPFNLSYYNGLSLKFKVDSDYTKQIISQKFLFKNIMQYEIAKQIVLDSINTNAFNEYTQSIDFKSILNYINDKLEDFNEIGADGKKVYRKGFYSQLNKEFQELNNAVTKAKPIKFL